MAKHWKTFANMQYLVSSTEQDIHIRINATYFSNVDISIQRKINLSIAQGKR